MSPWLGLDKLFIQIARLFLGWLARANTLPATAEELGLESDKPIVYVLRESSIANALVAEKAAAQLSLPSPMAKQTLGTQKIKQSHFALFRSQVFNRRQGQTASPKRLIKLVEALSESPDLDVQLVPVTLLWGRRPEKENSLWRILFSDNWSPSGIIRKGFVILLQGRDLTVEFSPAMSLRQLMAEETDLNIVTRKAQRVLRVHLRRKQEASIGPDLSHRRTLASSLVDSKGVREAIEKTAKTENLPVEKLEAKAHGYATEIAANYSHTVIRFLEIVLNWVWNRLYDGVRLHNIDRLREIAQDHEVVYVPCHRSHIDYLLLSYVVYKNNLVPPHIAAGINLNMPVLGPILRRGGAFFMRRSFKDNPVYAAVFNEYLHSIISRGFSIEYFVEGGRSRSGRMLAPKTGMLAMTVRSFLRDPHKPVAFVPVYIGYEKVLESRSYIGEMHGKKKQKESVFGLIKSSFSFLRSNFGEVHVNFGDPISLAGFLDQQEPQWRQNEFSAEQQPEWLKSAVNALGDEVVSRINSAAVINPINLLSLSVLASPKHTMDEEQLKDQLKLYIRLLEQAPYSPFNIISENDAQTIIDYGLNKEFISHIKHPQGNLINSDDIAALQMTYIRNNTLHLFILPGLVAALMRNRQKMDLSRFKQLINLLYPFFQTEYFLHWQEDELDGALQKILAVFIEQGLVKEKEGILRGAKTHTAEAELLDHLAQPVLQPLQRFALTIRILVQHGNGVISAKELEELAHLTAQRLSLLYEFNSPEFFDRHVLRNFIQQLSHFGLTQADDAGALTFTEELQALDDEAERLLNAEVSQTISRLTRLPRPRKDS